MEYFSANTPTLGQRPNQRLDLSLPAERSIFCFDMPLVFQYGSNCLEARLNSPERLDGGAHYDCRAQTVGEYEIAFDVSSRGNGCAAADLHAAEKRGLPAWGILYQMTDERLKRLRQIEGPKYEEKSVGIRTLAGEIKDAKTFLVKADHRQASLWTSGDYIGYIVKGLREHQVPEEYVQRVIRKLWMRPFQFPDDKARTEVVRACIQSSRKSDKASSKIEAPAAPPEVCRDPRI
jgi:AIG2-like family